jgi:gluconate 2-dehydrogenase gamma chain
MNSLISRRDLLKGAAIAGVAVAATPAASFAPADVFVNLTAVEGDLLEAIVARLIPTDANGPGATEARAAHYIDRALGGALAGARDAYRVGFAALDRYCRTSRGKSFLELSPADQDSVLVDVETGAATGSGAFFSMVKAHTWQGTFGDPYYGGNANFVGWDLIGYPGVRTNVTAADQERLEKRELKAIHRSAYDYQMFNKASARTADALPAPTHGHEAERD